MNQLRGDALRTLGTRAQAVAKLNGTEGWQALVEEWTERRRKYGQTMTQKLLSGGISAAPIDQREIDYQRGFFAAVAAILGTPERMATELEKALERQDNV
jgi:hypothetical protein